jgi:hypothetical protein
LNSETLSARQFFEAHYPGRPYCVDLSLQGTSFNQAKLLSDQIAAISQLSQPASSRCEARFPNQETQFVGYGFGKWLRRGLANIRVLIGDNLPASH